MIGELYDGEFENFTRDDGLLCSDCKYNVGDGCQLVFEKCQYEKVSDECPNDNNVSTKNTVSRETFEQVMWERDIAISQLKELGYGFGEKIEPCDDAISRDDALMCLTGEIKETDTIETIIARFARRIRKLPSVNRKRCDDCIWSVCNYNKVDWEMEIPTGHWIYKQYGGYPECGNWHCSECDEIDNRTSAHCPNCGARMVEPQERSDKE